MSALAIILTVAMVVPGDGQEKVSGEIAQQKLDVRGRWRGWCKTFDGHEFGFEADLEKYGFVVEEPVAKSKLSKGVESAGRLRFKIGARTVYGFYELRGDRLMICYPYDKPLPARFQGVMIFHPLKSSK